MGGSFQIPCGGLHERNPRTIYEYLWRLQTSYVLHVDLIGTGSHQDPQHAILFLYILVFGPLSTFIRSFTTRLYTLFFVSHTFILSLSTITFSTIFLYIIAVLRGYFQGAG